MIFPMMKLVIIILLFIGTIQPQSFGRYEIIIDHLELPKNDGLFDFATLRVKKFNRTTHVVTGYMDLLQPYSDDISVTFTFFSYQGNEFNKLADKHYDNMCTFLQKENIVMPTIFAKSSLGPKIESCPVDLQRISFYDLTFPSDTLALQPPKGEKYRFEFVHSIGETVISNFSAYILFKKIDGKFQVPKLG